MDNPLPTLTISSSYLLFLWLGPKYMEKREPFQLKKTLLFYNFSMVIFNFFICKEVDASSFISISSHHTEPKYCVYLLVWPLSH
jgi:elongation of very long chain fatty acids protein 4